MSGPALDPSWSHLWSPDLTDPALRMAVLRASRFADRVEGALLRDHFGHEDKALPEAWASLVNKISEITVERVHLAGLIWFAPVIAGDLLRGTSQLGIPRDRAILRQLLAHREGRPDLALVAPSSLEDVTDHGRACLGAWLDTFGRGAADRARLRLPRDLSRHLTPARPSDDRAAAFSAALDLSLAASEAA